MPLVGAPARAATSDPNSADCQIATAAVTGANMVIKCTAAVVHDFMNPQANLECATATAAFMIALANQNNKCSAGNSSPSPVTRPNGRNGARPRAPVPWETAAQVPPVGRAKTAHAQDPGAAVRDRFPPLPDDVA